jgi:hypothetical protein
VVPNQQVSQQVTQQASGRSATWQGARQGAPQLTPGAVTAATATLTATLRDGWRAGAAALWAAGRRREAAWLRAEYRAAAALVEAVDGVPVDAIPTALRIARRCCRAAARDSARHPLLAAPWRDAGRVLGVLTAARLGEPGGGRRQARPR